MRRNIFILFAVAVLLAACGPKGVAPVGPQDTPEHHYLRGMEALKSGMTDEAVGRFERSLALEPGFAPAMSAKAIVVAGQKDQWKEADNLLRKAMQKADDAAQRFIVRVNAVRSLSKGQPSRWVTRAEGYYKAAKRTAAEEGRLPFYQSIDAADYFMAKAYVEDGQFSQARKMLNATLDGRPGRWHQPANVLYKRVQKIERAMGQHTLTGVAKNIAVKESVSRADVCALLVDELSIDALMERAGAKQAHDGDTVYVDIKDHVFREEILTLRKWGIRGLSPRYDASAKAYLFGAEEPIKRKEMALVIEDILVRVTHDEGLATRYFGQESPFPDVPSSVAYYNAAMTVVSRNLMQTNLSGEFNPDAGMDGAELVLSIVGLRELKNLN